MAEIGMQPGCPPRKRPQELLGGPGVHGLRASQSRLVAGSRLVDVWLYGQPPGALANPALWKLTPSPGGARVKVSHATLSADSSHLELRISGKPDTARYRLAVTPPGAVKFDPLRTWLPVRLRPECPDLGTCFPQEEPAPLPSASPVHDYLARDWRSLARALGEFLLSENPDADLSIADPMIALIELFAHVGDVLHYRLDRTATEAYLETARLRTSVKRHARLVDFALSDGSAATTVVHVVTKAGGSQVSLNKGDVAVDRPGSSIAFTIETALAAEPALGEIPLYDWGEAACCLDAGSTECILMQPRPADALGANWLKAGDFLAFEVVDAGDTDMHNRWSHRDPLRPWPRPNGTDRFRDPLPRRPTQVVRLTKVSAFDDPLSTQLFGASMKLARVEWRSEDFLMNSYPVGIDTSSGIPEVTVARGNLVAAHHGRLVDGSPEVTLTPKFFEGADAARDQPFEYWLSRAGAPARNGHAQGPGLSLAGSDVQNGPKKALPHRLDVNVTLPSGARVAVEVVPSLLEAPAGQLAAVVDIEDRKSVV